jgi:hypothetical protein
MRQLKRVTMSMREVDRLKCIQAVIDGFSYGGHWPPSDWASRPSKFEATAAAQEHLTI